MKKVIEHVDALVTKVLPTKVGTTKDGKEYKVKEIWIKESEEDKAEMAVTMMTDEVNASEQFITEGAQIVLDIEISGHRVKYNERATGNEVEKVFNNINAKNISLVAIPAAALKEPTENYREKVEQIEQQSLSETEGLPF